MVTQYQLRRQQLAYRQRVITQQAEATPAPQRSYQELRSAGKGIAIKEKDLGAIQQKIKNVERKREERAREGKPDAETYRLDELNSLKERYEREVKDYGEVLNALGDQATQARQAAPKDYRTDLQNREKYEGIIPPNPVASIYDPGRTTRTEKKDSKGKITKIEYNIAPVDFKTRLTRVNEGNKQYEGRVVGSTFIGTRTVTKQEKNDRITQKEQQKYRQTPGVVRSTGGQVSTGTSILITEQGSQPKNASELFTALGAPKKKTVASIDFGREARKPLFGDSSGEEISRRSRISETTFLVPNSESAALAGFTTEGVAFPATYTAINERREDVPESTFLQVNAPMASSLGKKLTGLFESIDERAKRIADNPTALNARESVVIRGIQKTGDAIGFIGERVKAAGRLLTPRERTPLVTREQRLASRKLGPVASTKESLRLLGQELRSRAGAIGPTLVEAGSIITSTGTRLRENPVTAGIGEAVLFGTGVGALQKTGSALRTAGTIRREGKLVARAGTVARAQRIAGSTILGTEAVGGTVLGTVFVVDTAAQLSTTKQPGDIGRVIEDTGANLLGFGVGARVGSKGVDVGLTGARGIDQAVFVRTVGSGGNVRRSLRLEIANPLQAGLQLANDVTLGKLQTMGRRGEVGGRSAKQRSGRTSQAQLRQRKPNPNAPKFLVTKSPETVTAQLRGKARSKTEEMRLLELQVSRQGFQREQFISTLRVAPDVAVRVNAPNLIKADVVLPGTRSPGIRPEPGRVRFSSGESQVRMSQETMNQLISERRQDELSGFLSRQKTKGGSQQFSTPTRSYQASTNNPLTGGAQVAITKQRGKTTKEIVSTVDPLTKQKRRVSESEYAGKVYRQPEFIETTAPQEFYQQRPVESGFFARGSEQDRRARTIERLRNMMLKREETMRVQLPTVLGPREITVVGPQVKSLQNPGQNSLLIVGTGTGQTGATKFSFITESVSGVKTRAASLSDMKKGTVMDLSSISATRSAIAQRSEQQAATSLRSNQLTRQETRQKGIVGPNRGSPSIRIATPPRSERTTPNTPPPPIGPRPPNNPPRPRTPRPPETKVPPPPLGGSVVNPVSQLSKGELVSAFRALIKEKGSFRVLGSGLTKEQALSLGSQTALGSLAATFRVEETGQLIRKRTTDEPRGLGEYFREYRIKKGKRIFTPGTYVQKRGKRLVTRAEVSQLQSARRKSVKLEAKRRWL